MFLTLLLVTLVIAGLTAMLVARLFEKPIEAILRRIVSEELSTAWQRYVQFAIYVVGISGGVRIWDLERYVNPPQHIGPQGQQAQPLVLNVDRWTLEVYRTMIGTLQSIAWMLLVFFVFALIAYVVIRGFELRHGTPKRDA